MRGWKQCNQEETCANLLFLHVPLLDIAGYFDDEIGYYAAINTRP